MTAVRDRRPGRRRAARSAVDPGRSAVSGLRHGWGPALDPRDMVVSPECLSGNHWKDWLASDCPALLLHGTRSDVLSEGHAADSVARRPGTRLARLLTGHTVHESDPAGFSAVVREFLQSVGP